MACSWNKQPLWTGGYINQVNDAVVGGQLTTVPTAISASQGNQTLPGDHIVLDDATAQGLSKTSVGTVYGGYFQYVLLDASATTLYLGQVVYWKMTSNTTGVYTVTNVQTGNYPNIAGVVLNPSWTAGNYSFIQCLGRATTLVDAASGAVSIGSSMSLSTATSTSNGSVLVSASTAAAAPSLFVGISETAIASPVAGNTAIVDLKNVALRF
jgi:hypothetical protein